MSIVRSELVTFCSIHPDLNHLATGELFSPFIVHTAIILKCMVATWINPEY